MSELLPEEDYDNLPIEVRVEHQRQLARELGAYAGKYVIVKNATILGSGETLAEALGTGLDGTVFRVGDGTKMLLSSQ